MQKSKLTRFIQKYNLGGEVNSVKWSSDGDNLSTSFVTPDKSLLGNVKVKNLKLENSNIGVYQTDQLVKLLGVLGDDISLDLKKFDEKVTSLKVKNGSVSFDYVLSDLSVIAEPPALKKLPEFDTQIKLDNHFIETFIKGKSALSDVDSFTILTNKEGNLEVVIGYSSMNTNRINIPVESVSNNLSESISFNANLFKEVLSANRECTSAVLEVSNEGLARVNFKVDDYDTNYYIVAMKEVD
tara:strand:+ start:1834 stop:2556 length:723 start_codon:yes stop_codon:yes gene_type:complete